MGTPASPHGFRVPAGYFSRASRAQKRRLKEARANGFPHTALANQGFNGRGFCIFAVKCTRLARLKSLYLPTLRGFVLERARLATFRGFRTERARLGTFSGLGIERERRLKEARAYRLSPHVARQ